MEKNIFSVKIHVILARLLANVRGYGTFKFGDFF
jgi:hypothetical protein